MNGRNYFTQQPSRPARTVPVQRTQPQKPSTKVISVPVHFVSSEQPQTTSLVLKDSSAIKIQKTFRGFLVRKIVKKILSIRNEVVEIERKINNDVEFLDLIRKDAKERLRVTETLMSLLFKLDSIHGVDFGVRVLRKSVTNQAIALQEKVDSIGQQTLDSPKDTSISEFDNDCIAQQGTENINDCCIGEIDDARTEEQGTEDSNSAGEIVNDGGHLEAVDDVDDDDDDDDDDGDVVMEVVKEVDENCINNNNNDNNTVKEDGGSIGEVQKYEEKRELLEKLMDDNEKMMKLMTKMSETNEMQTRMINSLSGRIAQLEKAFLIDKMKMKKKKKTRICA